MQQIYNRNNHPYKKLQGLSHKIKCLQAWALANPRAVINSVILIISVLIVIAVVILLEKKHSHQTGYATGSTINQPNNSVSGTTTSENIATKQNTVSTSNNPASTIATQQPIATDSNSNANNNVASIANTSLIVKNVTIKKKDTLGKIFKRFGIDQKNTKTILSLDKASSLQNLRAGQKLTLELNQQKQLEKLTYQINITDTLTISKNNEHFQAKIDHIEPVAQIEYSSLIINGSIYASAKKAGISSKLINRFVNVFSDTTNLNKTLHAGDKIAFLYKDYYVNNQKLDKSGEIIAAEYTHAGKIYKTVSFTDPKGITNYYTPEGYALKSPFMRYPLAFRYIGSPFSLRRYNPILHAYYEHTGVDLVANAGTPIKAACDGVIATLGMDGDGYGNRIVIKHGKYSSLYAHMRGFAQGLHHGSFVKQGQLIGYVGMTGRATGPHLHYEFRVNNTPYDPVKTKLPVGEMIAKTYRNQFFAMRNKLLAQLNLRAKSLIAVNDDSTYTTKKL